MNRVKSFEEMGREADRASLDVTQARAWIQTKGSREATEEAITVAIKGANWGDGTLALQEHLTKLVRLELGELLSDALARMEEKARDARASLLAAMQGGAVPDFSPQVPRMAEDLPPPPPAPDEPPVPGEGKADTYAAAFAEMGPQARELLSWCKANPAARFARTPARDALVAGGYLRQNGAGPNATWDLTDEGQALAEFA